MNKANTRIPELDGMRGVAILLVIVWHYINQQIDDEGPSSSFVKQITSYFWSGVDLFFVLSGFLLGGILLRYKGSKNYFKTFYIRRFFRIIPLYYLILGTYIALYFSKPNITKELPSLFNDSIPIWSYVLFCQNFLMWIKQAFGAGWLGVTWSLAIEEQFYLLLPALICLLNKKSLLFVVILLIISATVYRSFFTQVYDLHLPFQSRMDTLFTGVLIALLFENENLVNALKSKKYIIYIFYLILFFGFIYFSLGNFFIPYYLTYSWLNLFYGVFIIIAILYKESLLSKILRNKMLCQIGVVSYGIYLIHVIVLYLIYWLLGLYGVDLINNKELLIVSAIAFMITLSLSFASYYFYENKLIKLGHRYKY